MFYFQEDRVFVLALNYLLNIFLYGLNMKLEVQWSGIWMINKSSRIVSRADGEGETLCIKIGYNEPRGAESREGSSTLAKSSRVFLGILDSDWPTKFRVFRARFWLAGFGHEPSVIGSVLR